MGVASIEPQEAAASLFYCVIMYAPSHKYLTHAQQITLLHLISVKKTPQKTRDTASNCKQSLPVSRVDAWVTMYISVVY